MSEDKLTRSERIRLEALAQAIAFAATQHTLSVDIISNAKIFEKFILEANADSSNPNA